MTLEVSSLRASVLSPSRGIPVRIVPSRVSASSPAPSSCARRASPSSHARRTSPSSSLAPWSSPCSLLPLSPAVVHSLVPVSPSSLSASPSSREATSASCEAASSSSRSAVPTLPPSSLFPFSALHTLLGVLHSVLEITGEIGVISSGPSSAVPLAPLTPASLSASPLHSSSSHSASSSPSSSSSPLGRHHHLRPSTAPSRRQPPVAPTPHWVLLLVGPALLARRDRMHHAAFIPHLLHKDCLPRRIRSKSEERSLLRRDLDPLCPWFVRWDRCHVGVCVHPFHFPRSCGRIVGVRESPYVVKWAPIRRVPVHRVTRVNPRDNETLRSCSSGFKGHREVVARHSELRRLCVYCRLERPYMFML